MQPTSDENMKAYSWPKRHGEGVSLIAALRELLKNENSSQWREVVGFPEPPLDTTMPLPRHRKTLFKETIRWQRKTIREGLPIYGRPVLGIFEGLTSAQADSNAAVLVDHRLMPLEIATRSDYLAAWLSSFMLAPHVTHAARPYPDFLITIGLRDDRTWSFLIAADHISRASEAGKLASIRSLPFAPRSLDLRLIKLEGERAMRTDDVWGRAS